MKDINFVRIRHSLTFSFSLFFFADKMLEECWMILIRMKKNIKHEIRKNIPDIFVSQEHSATIFMSRRR